MLTARWRPVSPVVKFANFDNLIIWYEQEKMNKKIEKSMGLGYFMLGRGWTSRRERLC
jgi:hypothetical protein